MGDHFGGFKGGLSKEGLLCRESTCMFTTKMRGSGKEAAGRKQVHLQDVQVVTLALGM